jgi:hypothetical protein
MSVSSVSSNTNAATAVQPQRQPERANEVENDGDKDDNASKAIAQTAPRPTVNTNGETVGSIVNTQA